MNTKSLDYINLKKISSFFEKNETKSKPIIDKVNKLNNFYLLYQNGFILFMKKTKK